MSNFDSKKEIRFLIQKKANSFCADCYDPCALYVDINNSVFLCRKCSEIHKKFGFLVKNTTNDIFTIEEIDKLKQSDNDTFNKKWMSLYSSQSTKIPFGASDIERQAFLYDKYVSKRWYSSAQNSHNLSFYKPHHLEIQETNFDDLDELISFDSSSSSSFLSDQADQFDFALSSIGQTEPEILGNVSLTIYQVKNSSSDLESEMVCFDDGDDKEFDADGDDSDGDEMIAPRKQLAKMKRSRRSSEKKEIKKVESAKKKKKKTEKKSEQKKQEEDELPGSNFTGKNSTNFSSCRLYSGQKMRTMPSSSIGAKKHSKIVSVERKRAVLAISNAIAFDIIRHKKTSKV